MQCLISSFDAVRAVCKARCPLPRRCRRCVVGLILADVLALAGVFATAAFFGMLCLLVQDMRVFP